jgi:hypothetical protein
MPEDSSNNNKKRKTTRKKTTNTAANLSGLEVSNFQEKPTKNFKIPYIVDEVIKEAFTRFYDNASLKQQKIKDLESLDVIAAEFLKTFIILGYDFNGEKIHIMHANTPQDKDALIEHLRTTFIGIINN